MKDFFWLAIGSLRKRILRTSLTMLGIFIGIAAVVALISLGQGMTDAINGQFASLGTDKIILQGVSAGFGPPGQNAAGIVTEDDVRLVRQVPGVQRAAGRLFRSGSVEFADTTQVIGVGSLPKQPDERDLIFESLNVKAEHGRLLKSSDKGKVMVGNTHWTGDGFPKRIEVGSKVLINGRQFEVVGLLDKGAAFANNALFMNEDDLRDVFGVRDEYSAVFAQIVSGQDVNEVAQRVLRAARRDRGQKEGFEDVTVQTSQELIDSINVILGVVSGIFVGIAAISLLVGGIGIMNTMYTAVLERTREIGIMKAIGARNRHILLIFLIESGVLGLAGGLIGVLLGMSMSKMVEIAAQSALGDVLQASFSPFLIVGALLFSMTIGIVSGVFPARQASKLPPVDALRGD